MRRIKNIISLCLLLAVTGSFSMAEGEATATPVKNPKELIDDLGHRAIQTLTNSNASSSQIQEQFVRLLEEGFDVPAIARFVLGRYWKTANEEQQQRFVKLFESRLKKAYANRFKEYQGVKFEVKETSQDKNVDVVHSTLQKPGGPVTNVDWKVKEGKIHDVVVDNISMSQTLRDDYASLVSSKGGDMDLFLKDLEAQK